MKTNKKLSSIVLTSAALFLFLIIALSTASASPMQNATSRGPFAYITTANNSVCVIDTVTNNVTTMMSYGPTYTPMNLQSVRMGKKYM